MGDFSDEFWSEIGRIIMYDDDWSSIADPVAIELACQDILEVEVDRRDCADARAMLASLGIRV